MSTIQREHHAKSIGIIESVSLEDARALVVKLAVEYPAILCELSDGVSVSHPVLPPPITLVDKVRELLRQDKKVIAIKLVRTETGQGLRESKYYVDNLEV